MAALMSRKEILSRLKSRQYECFYPRAMQRKFWDNITPADRKKLITRGEEVQNQPIPFLSAKDYMSFFRDGNRISYETPFFQRRQMLISLVLAECAEYKGRFMDDIAELLWQILAEPTWTLPAHQRLADYPLPGPEDHVVAIFSAETARILTEVLQFLQPELEKEFLPLINRIKHEVNHRVLEVCEQKTFGWYNGTNNWSVWCCYSINSAAITLWQDEPERLADFLAKHIVPIQKLYDHYPEDGGCDEGASYWMVAVGMLLNALDILQHRLGGFEEWLAEPKLRRMVEFIPRVNLCGKWFMGYSDAESFFPKFPRGLFLRYASMVNSTPAVQLALEIPVNPAAAPGNRNLSFLETTAELAADFSPRGKFKRNAVDFWKDLQIWIARRDPENSEHGMVCTIKGGHNNQAHNHLDLGHFSLWNNNEPVIVDVGRGIYNKTCFSNKRYSLWNLNSSGHNAAVVNGCSQGLGPQFKAELSLLSSGVSCDLTGAFEPENGVKHYSRKVETLWQKNQIVITEEIEVDKKSDFTINFYTPVKPENIAADTLKLKDIELKCSGISIVHAVESDKLDSKLATLWGTLWEIRLAGSAEKQAEWTITFTGIQPDEV